MSAQRLQMAYDRLKTMRYPIIEPDGFKLSAYSALAIRKNSIRFCEEAYLRDLELVVADMLGYCCRFEQRIMKHTVPRCYLKLNTI